MVSSLLSTSSFPSSNTESVMQTSSFFSATKAEVGPFQWIFTVDPSGHLESYPLPLH
jgi:hypothetical protein